MRTAVQFGAGNIGRGFTGQLFSESGFEVVFVDVVADVVDRLNVEKQYVITIAKEPEETVTVRNVRAVNGRDVPLVARELLKCDVACTAVGVNVLGAIAPPIAEGLKLRMRNRPDDTLNIIVCENMLDAAGYLKQAVYGSLKDDEKKWTDSHIGFSQAVVGRMVPVRTHEERARDPLGIRVEEYKKLPVDADALVGEFPEISGVLPKRNFQAYIDQKLFEHNLGHAVSAYFGALKGLSYIWECMEDPWVRRMTESAMWETGKALIKKYNIDEAEQKEHIDDLLNRFANKTLGDTVARVGGDPLRKLGPEDRLVGAALFCMEQSVEPVHIAKAVAAGLRYSNPDDPSAVEVQKIIDREGIEAAVEKICGIDAACDLGIKILSEYKALA